jgi:hypothetical protein
VLTGTLALAAEGAAIVGTPRFPRTVVRLRVAPSPESLAKIDALVASRDELCRWVLEQVDPKRILTKQLEDRGFDVELPLHKIRPFRFPAGLRESVDVGGRPLALAVELGALRMDEATLWAGARVAVRPAPAEAPPP